MKPFIVPCVIYPFDVLVCLGSSREEILSFLKKNSPTESDVNALKMYGLGRTVLLDGGQTILWIKRKPKKGSGVLAHEIFHAVDFLFDMIGIKLSRDSDEAYAYAIQHLTNEINKKL